MVCKMQWWIVSSAPHLEAGIRMYCLAILLLWKLTWSLKFHSAQLRLKISSFGLMYLMVSILWSPVTGSSSKTNQAHCRIISPKVKAQVFGVIYGGFRCQTKSKTFFGRPTRKLYQLRKMDNYTLPTCGLSLILCACPWFQFWHFAHLWFSPLLCRNLPLYFPLL